MLAGLRHDPFVGGDHQGHQVDPGRSRHHVFDEFLVPRHVHDPEALSPGEVHVRETELDRDAPEFFFLEASVSIPVAPG